MLGESRLLRRQNVVFQLREFVVHVDELVVDIVDPQAQRSPFQSREFHPLQLEILSRRLEQYLRDELTRNIIIPSCLRRDGSSHAR